MPNGIKNVISQSVINKHFLINNQMKKYNFNAGPSMLPREVIENTAKQCLDFNGSGLSLMEISHRAKDFQPVLDEAESLIKELLQIPDLSLIHI